MAGKISLSQYVVKLNKTIENFDFRIKKLEWQVAVLSKEAPEAVQQGATPAPTKRGLGWVFIWIGVLLFIAQWFGFRLLSYILPYGLKDLLILGLVIAGIIILVTNPKKGKTATVKLEKQEDKEFISKLESIYLDEVFSWIVKVSKFYYEDRLIEMP